jgi:hypothetical protein
MRVRTLCLGALACLLVPGSAIPAAGTDATTGGRGAGLRGYIADREYEAGPNAEGLQAPNRAHDLRTYFDPAGIRVVGRSADGAPELLSLRLAGVGRGLRSRAVAPGTLRVEGARVELHRPGLVEWYVNSRDGLEHGFDLAERLPGQAPLRLELRLLRARAALTGRRISIETDAGRRLFYGKLAVFDARGAALPAHFEVPEPQRVSIVVDDRRARYPITIDPLLTSSADAQLEADQAGAALGTSVAGAGDGYADVLVGAPDYDAGQTDEGAAFVFLGGPLGVADGSPASAAATLQSDQASAHLGASVAAADVNGDGYARRRLRRRAGGRSRLRRRTDRRGRRLRLPGRAPGRRRRQPRQRGRDAPVGPGRRAARGQRRHRGRGRRRVRRRADRRTRVRRTARRRGRRLPLPGRPAGHRERQPDERRRHPRG